MCFQGKFTIQLSFLGTKTLPLGVENHSWEKINITGT